MSESDVQPSESPAASGPPEPPVPSERAWVPRLRVAIFLSAWVGLAWFLFAHAAGPVTWDELLYLSQSLHPEAAPHILNRFAHIYAQKLFVELTGDAITGARLFWAVLVASTSVFVFLSARRMAGSVVAGVVALLLFFAVPVLHRLNGITYADVSVMFLASLSVWLVLGEPSAWKLVGLGFALLAAAKCKESAVAILPVLFVVLGAGVPWSRRVARSTWILLGGVLAMAALMGLDAVFLGDALFQVRLENLRECLAFNQGREFERSSDQWMSFLGTRSLLFAFVCYLLAFVGPREGEARAARRAVAAIPLVLIAFLTLTMIRGPWGVVTRYLIPALPAMAVAGALLLEGRFDAVGRRAFVAGGAGLAFGWVLDRFGGSTFADAGWTQALFRDAILYPLAFLAFLGWLLPRRDWRLGSAFIAGTACVFLLILPAQANLDAMVRGNLARFSRSRFEPLELLSRDTPELGDAVVFMSPRIHEETKLLARHERAARWMLQIHFNEALGEEQVMWDPSLTAVRAGEPDYAFVTQSELAQLQRAGGIDQLYRVVTGKKRRLASVVLLSRLERP